jgi:predicted porin
MRLKGAGFGVALLTIAGLGTGGMVHAADLGGDCCADLEERIAELEATSARKGNRKVSLTIAGQVNQAVLLWDDGHERNAYVVGNKNDQSNFSFTGEAEISKDLKAGYAMTIRLRDTVSDEVSQDDDDSTFGFVLWESYWFLESERLGKLSVGQTSRVSDTAPENDLSESGLPGYAGVQDMGGGFFLRRTDGALAALAWGDLYNHFNGDTANVVRYDTPAFSGLVLSASYGEDDIWDVGAKYEGEGGGFKIAASIAYTEVTDENGLDGGGDLPNSTVVGSIAILHEPSGLNALIAAGNRSFDAAVVDADGALRTPGDASFVYAKLGWLAKLNGLGPTAFYGEWGRFQDYVSAGIDPAGVASLAVGGVQSCALAGVACRITGNEAEVWGLGVVQHIEAAEMQIYLGYRHHEADFDLVDGAGAAVGASGTESFDTIVMGSKIAF